MKFESFSAQAFECLAQALCVKILGPGTVVFGGGPDGAREATFDGKVPFPSAADRWNGYIVVQAKCREKLKHNQEDATWLCAQLTKDLKKFQDKKRALRKPDYFLLISNVTLSSVAKSGGKAKVEDVLSKFSSKLGLRGFAVWGADELRALLEDAEEIRRAYTAWLTPHDVLADLVARLARPNLTKLLPLSLARDLRDERDVRLKDAGQETDKAIYLEQVFIDLPLSRHQDAKSASFPEAQHQEGTPNIVAKILRRAADKLDPISVENTKVEGEPLSNRIVILGGPGQGKSTLSQFLVQYERARLLSSLKRPSLTPQTRDLLKPIFRRAEDEGLPSNGPLRFPIRVNLPDFADAISANEDNPLTLLSFISFRLSREIDLAMSGDDLRHWLGTCPSLVVLDGLDEVPPTANRQRLISAIEGFWDDLHLVGGDTLMVVTTRPQGYNQDLDPAYWDHWELSPLTLPYAQRFASRLCEVRVSDKSLRSEIIGQIENAAKEESTKALITSPLQVAIMFGIILLKGAVPKDRWDLFDRYYSLLRDREAQKPASIVRDFKRQIDVLHQEVGFLLHVSAEDTGRSVAFVTKDQLGAVIKRMLLKEEFSGLEIERISDDLSRAATHRLVFLNAKIADRIAFDVRSLQEFMAAAQITSASPAFLIERLRAISTSAHWRNVFRIAASKIFSVADFGHYRDDIVAICHALDAGDLGEQFRVVRGGATLALELLADGVASSAPRFRRSLLRRAFSILDVGFAVVPEQLILQLTDENMEVVTEEVVQRLEQGETVAADGAMKFLFEALQIKSTWAEQLILKNWFRDPNEALDMLGDMNLTHLTEGLIARLKTAQWLAGPDQSRKFQFRLKSNLSEGQLDAISVLPAGCQPRLSEPSMLVTVVPGLNGKDGLTTRLESVASSKWFNFGDELPSSAAWSALFSVAAFCKNPSKETLAAIFDEPAANECQPFSVLLPWIIRVGFQLESEGRSLSEVASLVRSGSFGDRNDWVAAEARWAERGLFAADFLVRNEPNFLGSDIAHYGAPCLLALQVTHSEINIERLIAFCGAVERMTVPSRQVELVRAAIFMSHSKQLVEHPCISSMLDVSMGLLKSLNDRQANMLAQYLLDSPLAPYGRPEFMEYLDAVGEHDQFNAIRLRSMAIEDHRQSLLNEINTNRSRRGLLVMLAKFAMVDGLKSDMPEISPEILIDRHGDGAAVSLAISILKITTLRWEPQDIPRLAEVFVGPILSREETRIILSRVELHPNGLALLIEIGKASSRNGPNNKYTVLNTLQRVSDKKRSILSVASERVRLDLPSPPEPVTGV